MAERMTVERLVEIDNMDLSDLGSHVIARELVDEVYALRKELEATRAKAADLMEGWMAKCLVFAMTPGQGNIGASAASVIALCCQDTANAFDLLGEKSARLAFAISGQLIDAVDWP